MSVGLLGLKAEGRSTKWKSGFFALKRCLLGNLTSTDGTVWHELLHVVLYLTGVAHATQFHQSGKC